MARRHKKITIPELEIEKYAAGGKSIGYYEGKVVFVPQTIPGDVAKVYLTKNKKDYAEGKVLEIVKDSPDRKTARCEYFGSCGGCQWQMLDYEKQIQYKAQQVKEQMHRVAAKQDYEVLPLLSSSAYWHYRNKVEFSFSNKQYLSSDQLGDESISSHKNVLGFHAKGLFDKVVEIRECLIQPEQGNAIRNFIADITSDPKFEYIDMRSHEGFLRNVTIRETTDGECMVNLIVASGYEELLEEILTQLKAYTPAITSIYYTINDKPNDSIFDLEPVHVFGKEYITERLGNFLFRISPKSFFQTNTVQAELLYKTAKDMLELQGHETLYDIYCGTGSIGIYMSDEAEKIVGVEIVEEAIQDADLNAQLNNVADKTTFIAGDVSKVCTADFFDTQGKPDAVIVDPPRMGLTKELVAQLNAMAVPKLLYISCNPATQTRDLEELMEVYDIVKMQAVDLFPHTHHIENIALLQLKNL